MKHYGEVKDVMVTEMEAQHGVVRDLLSAQKVVGDMPGKNKLVEVVQRH